MLRSQKAVSRSSVLKTLPVPIVPQFRMSIAEAERSRLIAIAERLVSNEPALSTKYAFGPSVKSGMLDGPMLVIGDHSEIPLISAEAGDLYQYRMALLARDGDIVAISARRTREFERYIATTLGLGTSEFLDVDSTRTPLCVPLAKLCCEDETAFERIVAVTRDRGCLTIMPHIGTGHPWLLAGAVARSSHRPVRIAAPPPRLTRRVNHKLWFSELVSKVLGSQAQPKVFHTYGPAALVGQVTSLARRYDRIAVKVPDSAGSAGNISIWSKDIRDLSSAAVHSRLFALLHDLGWDDKYPLLTQVWDCPVHCSPSVQCWIPNQDEGQPIIEGIFEQIVEGTEAEFVGSRPAQLPANLQATLADQAYKLTTVLQSCGYYGRCSFDAVFVGPSIDSATIHWIECNGRWGGVSIPMTLVNRLTGDWTSKPFVVVQKYVTIYPPLHLDDVLERLAERLFVPGQTDEGIVVLSPIGYKTTKRLHFAALGRTPERAVSRAKEAAGLLLG